MACRIKLYATGLLLLLSLLHTNESAYIAAIKQMTELGNDALKHLETEAALAMRKHTGPHTAGCIREAKEDDRLDCALVSTFALYLKNATDMSEVDDELLDKLLSIRQHVEDLHDRKCSKHPAKPCEEPFYSGKNESKNLEKLRSLLVLFLQWIDKPMK